MSGGVPTRVQGYARRIPMEHEPSIPQTRRAYRAPLPPKFERQPTRFSWQPIACLLFVIALAVCFLLWIHRVTRVGGVGVGLFLIPALMLFKVGEFTALIAVMLYAIVPPIRYVEHGVRNVAPDVVEAVRQMGSTPSQLLWQVKLPLALPVVMLGLNQTIMAALSMLAIAAMVGTRDLGQQVYVGLGKADAGMGLIAGLAIAFIAITSDRITQAWLGQQPGASTSSRH